MIPLALHTSFAFVKLIPTLKLVSTTLTPKWAGLGPHVKVGLRINRFRNVESHQNDPKDYEYA